MNFGLDMNFANIEKSMYGNVEEDKDLEAELMALMGEEESKQRPMVPVVPKTKEKKRVVGELDPSILAAALADVPNENLVDENDLEEDKDLLNELGALVGGGTVSNSLPQAPPSNSDSAPFGVQSSMVERLVNLGVLYKEKLAQCQMVGESSKVRRYQRIVDKIGELRKRAEKGEEIDEDEIPVVPPGTKISPVQPSTISRQAPPVPSRQAPPPLPPRSSCSGMSSNSSSKREQVRSILQRRRDSYATNGKLAVVAKDKTAALQYVQMSKQFDQALQTLDTVPEDDLDLEEIPGSPTPFVKKDSVTQIEEQPNKGMNKREEKRQRIVEILKRRKEANIANGRNAVEAKDKEAAMDYMKAAKQFEEALKALDTVSIDELDEADIPPSPKSYERKVIPKSFSEGLMIRQKAFEELAAKYKERGEDRKYRMNIRMASNYIEALKEHKRGAQINIDDLPTLPNMDPLPSQNTQKSTVAAGTSRQVQLPETGPFARSGEEGVTRNETQLQFLIQRQKEFKQAAIHAKSHGNMEMAKKYLLEAKGFDPMIKASQAGLPVSIKNTPIPPQDITPSTTLQPKIVPVRNRPSDTGVEGRGEVLSLLEKTLIEQIQKAETNRMRFTRLGDVGKVKLFEEWAKNSKKDLLLIREIAKQNLRIPQFHYENRPVPNADIFPELAEDVLELTIHNAVQIPSPSGYESSDANIFVRYVFPFPSESHQMGKTKMVSGSFSPEFHETFILQIGTRKSRGQKLTRVLKRAPLHLEVFQKGGFLRSDKLLGTVDMKMDELEGNAQMEECSALKDGRKAIGGMVRVRIRVREPLGDVRVGVKQEKWLILDN